MNEKGEDAIKSHYYSKLRAVDKFFMKRFGIKQRIEDNILLITIDNVGIKLMEDRGMSREIDIYFETQMCKLTNEIDKLGVSKDVDYSAEVLKNG